MPLAPTAKKRLRQEIARFCLVAQKYEERWPGLGTAPATTLYVKTSGSGNTGWTAK